MRIISKEELIVEEEKPVREVKMIPRYEIDEEYRKKYDEFQDFFGHGYEAPISHKTKRNPATIEFDRVQKEIYALGQNKKLSLGEKRKKANKIVNDYKAFLRGQNIRYRNLYNSINVPNF